MPVLVKAALLGIVQGVTEFLPISSTAHLIIGSRLIGYDDPGGVFTVMIQLGSILAVVWLYRAKVADTLGGLTSRPESRRFALAVGLAFVPALVGGGLLSGFVKQVLYNTVGIIAAALVVGGIVMLVVDKRRPEPSVYEAEDVPQGRAVFIGFWQMLALVPGVSRSAATMVGGMVAAVDRRAAAEFSFFLAMPTMAAAFAHDLIEVQHQLAPGRALEIAIGFVMAFLASALVVKPFVAFLARSGFVPFAWYRIATGLALFAAISAGWL
jgi:undecaprenyl-diphosphatase